MALDQEARAEALDTYKLMSAGELNAQLGDDADHDALIQEVLAKGKAVEVKGPQMADDEHSGQAGTHHSIGAGNDDDDENEVVTEVAAVVGEDPATTAAAEVVDESAAAEAVAEVPELAPEAAPVVELAPLDLSYLDAKREAEFAKLDAAKADGLTKLMAGEIEAADYAKIDAQYMRDRDAVREDVKAEGDWMAQVHAFKAQAMATSGINYDTDTEKAQAWDDWVKRLADKPEHAKLTGEQFLQMAHKKVLAEFDIAPKTAPAAPAPAAAPAKPAPAAPVVKKGRAPDLSGIPPTLGSLPAASNADSGDGGEFAHLAGLSGYSLEKACFAMTPDQQARYLSE
jgi:hypothetical protein